MERKEKKEPAVRGLFIRVPKAMDKLIAQRAKHHCMTKTAYVRMVLAYELTEANPSDELRQMTDSMSALMRE